MRVPALLCALLPLLTWAGSERLVSAQEPAVCTATLELEHGSIGGYVAGRVPLREVPPAGTTPLAGLTRPRYGRVRMAESEGLTVCLDADPKGARLWVDSDFDQQLDDERVTHLTAHGESFTREQTIQAPYQDTPYAVPLSLYFTYSPAVEEAFLTLSVRSYRFGTTVLGGRLRNIALVDRNYDARFDDPEHDQLYVDLDGDGEFETRGEAAERIPLAEAFRIGEEGWIAVASGPSGRIVEFRPTTTLPPPRERAWPEAAIPPSPALRAVPKENFGVLRARHEGERSKSYQERQSTIRLIGALGTSQALAFLQEIATQDKDAAIRSVAIQAMGNAAFLEGGGPWMLALAQTADKSNAGSIANALHAMGHPGRLPVLLNFGRAVDHQIIAGTVSYLAWTRTEESRKAILDVLHHHPAPIARYHTYLSGARNLEGGPPIPAMLFAAEDEYPLLRSEAVRDLYRVGHKEARRLALKLARERPVNTALGTTMAQVLGAMGDAEAVEAMLAFAEDGPVPTAVRQEIVNQLRYVRAPGSVAALLKGLTAREPATRAIAAEVLASIVQPSVTEALLKQAKKEKDERVQALLLEALGDHRDPQALDLLFKFAGKSRKSPEYRSATSALARLGLDIPKVRQHFLKLLDSTDDEDRILALDAAAASGDPTFLPRIQTSLIHNAWQVRLAAVQAVRATRTLACIPLLIGRLTLETSLRVRNALADALFHITGMNLYDDANIWSRWWKENQETFRIPTEIPVPPEEWVGGSQVGFYGIPVQSGHVVFLIDQSGSMSAPGAPGSTPEDKPLNRLDLAVQEVSRAIERMPDGARANVILFQSTISPWAKDLQKLERSSRGELEKFLSTVLPNGGTNIYDGLELALTTPGVDTVFLLSDGVPGAGKFLTADDIVRAVRRVNQTRRIAIHTVAIGMDSDLLRRLAAENDGTYVRR